MNAKCIDAATLTKTLHQRQQQQQQQQSLSTTQQQLTLLQQPTVIAATTTTSATFAVRKNYASIRKRIKLLEQQHSTQQQHYTQQQQQQQQQQRPSDVHLTAEAAKMCSTAVLTEDRDLDICLRGKAAATMHKMRAIKAVTTANSAVVADDKEDSNSNRSSSNSICLICRQQLSKCCLRCCQHLLSTAETQKSAATSTPATTATTATSTAPQPTINTDSCQTCSCRQRMTTPATASSSCRHCQHCLKSTTKTPATAETFTTATFAPSYCCANCHSLHKLNDLKRVTTATETMATTTSSQTSLATTRLIATKAAKTTNTTSFSSSSSPAAALTAAITAATPSSAAAAAQSTKFVREWLPSLSCTNDQQLLSTIAAETLPITTPTTTAATSLKIAAKNCKDLLFNAIILLQFLLHCLQTHALLHLFKWRRRSRQRRKRQQHLQFHQYKQQPQHHYHHQHFEQQPGPPCNTRLRLNSYSYRTEPATLTANTTIATTTTTSHQQHLHHRKKQQQHQPRRSSQHLNQPNYSVLYIILIALSFLSSFLPSTQAQTSQQPVKLTRNETVCKSLDIRNTPNEFNQLRNCTVIEGFLLITLLNTNVQMEITETFPLLTEVTEYIMIYRVHYLRSLAQIFPNLSIIRGRELFEGYALTVYSNPHLEELGLSKLITISRGGVRIENNLSLCFVNTIDWSQIVTNTTDIIIEKNRADIECPQCPGLSKYSGSGADGSTSDGDVVCKERQGRRHCWNSKQCQTFCPDRCRDNCIDENTCCNESCLGGCAANDYNVCNSCRHFSINNSTCIDKCPNNFYTYLDRRCITAESCARIGSKFENNKEEQLVPYDGQCSTRCPEGYNKVAGTCRRCGDKCEKHCPGGLIDSVARAKEYHGCTHITESGLTISIKRGGRHLMEDLEFGLSSIEVIETYLKVHRTYGMFSLEYFKNLRQISGKVLCEERFALYMLENNDLETIWRPNQTVRIEEGRVFFHFNPKLCVSVIEALRPMMKHNATFDKNEVATDSNGSKGSCNTEYLNTTIFKTSHTMAIVDIVNPLVFEDERTFIGYQYFYMEDKYRNATKHGHRPCDDGWTADEPTKETRHVYTRLKPFTQYAYYVKTMTISSEPRNAQSPIQYFKTKSAQPKNVRILTSYANSSSEIVVNWLPPTHIYGNLTMYKVRAKLAPKSPMMESRNYCKDPLKEAAKIDQPTSTQQQVTEKPIPLDCKCPKDGLYDDEKADANIHDSIDFENTVQNFVYVKQDTKRVHPNTSMQHDDMEKRRRRRRHSGDFDTFLLRHMRALDDEIDDDLSLSSSNNNSILSTTTIIPTLEDSSNSSLNLTRMDANEEYFLSIVDAVNATTTEYVFQRLKHFSVYVLDVEACREPEEGAMEKECSDLLPIYVRTLKRDDVDKVQNLRVQLENTNTSRSNIRLRWDPPESPNGAVVSYTISYEHQTQDAVEEKRCITDLDYQNLTNGYVLSGLPTGNYSIRVRANSLAGEGVFSEYVYIFIPPTQISNTVIAMISIAVIILVVLLVVLLLYCRKRILIPPSELKMFPSVNPYYDSLQYIPDEWEVPRERIIQLSALGQGSFGMVYEGILKGQNNSMEDTACAIKTVNENATDRERMNFLNEASVMKQFDTYHVVRLLGVCSRGQPALVIMELMKNGDLKSYLRAHRPDERDDGLLRINELTVQPPPLSRIYQMAIEIADGMAYLAAKKFVHRDLAARNCMVAADLTVKIGDFGMTRDIYETDYYRKGTKGLLPVRWMPPESLRDGVYSSASDVFSYGVVLWEMATLASQPYQGLSNDQVLRYVIDGGIMERPENCPEKLYRLMEKCWHHRPTARPTFMGIIGALLDHASEYFQKVSFYHSEEGITARNKELHDFMHQSGLDIFHEHDNDTDDVTTPLRVGEYNEYKMNMENTSSVENQNESPAVDDIHHPHSPYSLGSGNIISSTPDGKNSYNPSQISHNNQTLSSAPSTSAGIVSGGGITSQLHQPHHRLIHPRFPQRKPQLSHGDDAAYVQPDYDARDFRDEDEITLGRNISKSADTDERGYQVYDPSPNYREHVPYDVEDEEAVSGISVGSKLSGAQNLLPKQQRSRQRLVTIIPMSSSMPDEAIGVPMASSLHPSTGSAASSNASSNATAGAVGKYPSLKKAVSETVQSVGNSLVPQRLRNMNRFFNHKRSGSNTSHKSTGSNPNATYSNTNLNQQAGSGGVSGGRGRSISGSNLGTIESGGSGSASSYAPTAPRFYKTSTSENPNYNLLDETANASGISVVDGATPSKPQPIPTVAAATTFKPRTGFSSSSNPNYQLLNESLNTSVSPTRPPFNAFRSAPSSSINPNYELMQAPKTSENPTYELMQAPEGALAANPNYVMMSEPQAKPKPRSVVPSFPAANLSENPNYQMMGPAPTPGDNRVGVTGFSTLSAAMRREASAERFSISNSHSSHSATASSSSDGAENIEEDDEEEEEDEEPVEGIKMERIPLSRSRRSSERRDKKQTSRSRSRSQSQAKSVEEKLPTPTTTKKSPQQAKSSAFTTKEKWLRQQSQQKQPQQPPNGFIGREG